VRAVSDGAAALAAVRDDPPDLIVSDVMMPGLDGMELLAAVRADPWTARVPVLLLSARAGQEAAVEGLAGADDYLVKPFSAAELLARVGAHLQLGRARREAEARFTAIADLAPALIWVAGPDGARVFVNAGWRQFTGRTAGEAGADWQAGLHPQDQQRYREAVAAAMAAGRGWEVEFRLRRADGVYRWLLERAVPIGPTEGRVGSCTDINARYRESERQTLLARFGAGLESEPDPTGRLARLARLVIDARLADLCCVLRCDDHARLRPDGMAAVDVDAEFAVAGIDPESPTVREVVTTGRPRLIADVPVVASPGWSAADGLPDQLAPSAGSPCGRPFSCRCPPAAGCSACWPAPARRLPTSRRRRPRADGGEVAGRAALALDNAMLLVEERATASRLAVLQRATARLSAAVTPAEVGRRRVPSPGCSATSPPSACTQGRRLRHSARPLALEGVDDADPAWPRCRCMPRSSYPEAVREQRPLWGTTSVTRVGRASSGMGRPPRRLGIRGVIALPLVAGGRVVGVLGVGFRVPLRHCAIERATLLALAEQCAQALDRARLYRAEHQVAETLQRSLLPQQLPQLPRLALDARYLPGAEGVQAGGDWYDVIELDEHRVAIAVGDVVGQGAAAAAVMGQLRSALAAALLQGHAPAAARELRDRFAARVPGARASTAACVTLDWAAGRVCWARAGHPPPLLADTDGVRLLDGDGHGPVLGSPAARRTPRASPTSSPARRWSSHRRARRAPWRGHRRGPGPPRRRGAPPRQRPPGRAGPRRARRPRRARPRRGRHRRHRRAPDPAPLRERLPAHPAQLAVVPGRSGWPATSPGSATTWSDDLPRTRASDAANAVELHTPWTPPPAAVASS
jgi:PAS domain S-box-containing protein